MLRSTQSLLPSKRNENEVCTLRCIYCPITHAGKGRNREGRGRDGKGKRQEGEGRVGRGRGEPEKRGTKKINWIERAESAKGGEGVRIVS